MTRLETKGKEVKDEGEKKEARLGSLLLHTITITIGSFFNGHGDGDGPWMAVP